MLQASNAKQVLQPAAGFAGTGRWRCWNRLWRGVASSTRDVGTAFAVCWKRQTNCYSGAKALSSRPATCYNETRFFLLERELRHQVEEASECRWCWNGGHQMLEPSSFFATTSELFCCVRPPLMLERDVADTATKHFCWNQLDILLRPSPIFATDDNRGDVHCELADGCCCRRLVATGVATITTRAVTP